MMKCGILAAALLLIAQPPQLAVAEDVTVEGAHLCCGACLRAATKALSGVDGVTAPSANRRTKVISFKAKSADAANAGLAALAKAGFYGTPKIGGKAAKFPGSAVKAGTKANEFTLVTHLCCGGCVRAAANAVKGIDGVESTSRLKNNFTIKGKQFDVAAVIAALNKAGFNAKLPKKDKK